MYPGELDRLFERILGGPVGDGTCWVSIGRGDLGSVFLGSVMSLGSLDICETSSTWNRSWTLRAMRMVRTLVEYARGEALSEHRRRDLVANWDPSAPIFGLTNDLMCLRVDCCHESMVSHRGSRTAFPPAEVSLEREAALPVRSQSAPPSARVFKVDGSPRIFVECVGYMSGRTVLSLRSAHSRWRFHEFAFHCLQMMRLIPGVSGVCAHVNRFLSVNAGNPELTGGRGFGRSCLQLREASCHTRDDESSITAVELAAMHPELAADPLLWFVRDGEALAFVGCRSPAVAWADPSLVQRWIN